MINLMALNDRVAIVTGGGKGIGAAIALRLAQHGATVIIAARDRAKLSAVAQRLQTETGKAVSWRQVDVENEDEIVHLVQTVTADHGCLDIMVNNAGGPTSGHITEISASDWDACLSLNLRNPFLCSREAANVMLKQGSGVIINISSISGLHPVPMAAAYSAAKAGLQNFTQACAAAWGDRGVRVNAIAAGTVVHDDKARSSAFDAKMASRVPLGRLATADEIANVALFLASDAASYVTGVTIPVTGGLIDPAVAV